MDYNTLNLISICILNSFICFLIFLNLIKKSNKKNNIKFFGLCLDKDIYGGKKYLKYNLEDGYNLHINNIMPGDLYESTPLVLKIKTKLITKNIFVYRGNPNDWNPYIDLKFGEKDEYIMFEYNTRAFLSGIYMPQ